LVISIVVVGVGHAGIATLATVPVIVLISKFIGTYDLEDLLVRKSTLDETATLFQVATLYALTAWLIDGLVVTGERGRRELIVLWAALFALLLVFRAIARAICRAVTRPERCVLIADEETCNRIRSKFGRSRTAHSEVVGCILPHDRASEHAVTSATHDVVELRKILEPLRADRVIIAPAEAEEHELVNLVHAATLLRLKVSVVPRVLEVVGPSVHVDDVEGLPLLSTRPFGLSRSSRVIKRGLDLVGSGVMLIVLSPMMTMAAIAIKLDSHGPVFFRQHRVGRDGAPFEMLKFRTMSPDAEARKQALVEQNEADGMFKIANDPRITRVGRVLRRTSLDELPQLLHVFRGQMSLVGPRPLVQEEDIRIVGWRRRRLQLVPGMTGYWQVLGSSRIPLDEMVRIDYLYVSNWSLWLDLKILLRTVGHVFTARGM
jgi:exopolysaccharide biosynthesis polyprenyl glycosylphosphotransferase